MRTIYLLYRTGSYTGDGTFVAAFDSPAAMTYYAATISGVGFTMEVSQEKEAVSSGATFFYQEDFLYELESIKTHEQVLGLKQRLQTIAEEMTTCREEQARLEKELELYRR